MRLEELLEVPEQSGLAQNRAGRGLAPDAKRAQRARRFADIPFHGVQSVATIGDVSDAQVFAGGQEIFDSLWY